MTADFNAQLSDTDSFYHRGGATGLAVPRGASLRPLRRGEPIVVDHVFVLTGYLFVDQTRIFSIGPFSTTCSEHKTQCLSFRRSLGPGFERARSWDGSTGRPWAGSTRKGYLNFSIGPAAAGIASWATASAWSSTNHRSWIHPSTDRPDLPGHGKALRFLAHSGTGPALHQPRRHCRPGS